MLYDEFQVGVVTCTEQEIDGEFQGELETQ